MTAVLLPGDEERLKRLAGNGAGPGRRQVLSATPRPSFLVDRIYVLLSGVSARRTLPAILDFTSSLELSLNLRNSHAKPALDFGDVSIVAEMSAFIEVLEVGAKFLEKITWGPGTHRRLNLARMRVEVCPVRDNG